MLCYGKGKSGLSGRSVHLLPARYRQFFNHAIEDGSRRVDISNQLFAVLRAWKAQKAEERSTFETWCFLRKQEPSRTHLMSAGPPRMPRE